MQRCPRGRRSMIGNHVYGYTVPRVRIPLSAPSKNLYTHSGVQVFILHKTERGIRKGVNKTVLRTVFSP